MQQNVATKNSIQTTCRTMVGLLAILLLLLGCAGSKTTADRTASSDDKGEDATQTAWSGGAAPEPLTGRNLLGYEEAQASCSVNKTKGVTGITFACQPVKMINGKPVKVSGFDPKQIRNVSWQDPKLSIGGNDVSLPASLGCVTQDLGMKFVCANIPIDVDLGRLATVMTVQHATTDASWHSE